MYKSIEQLKRSTLNRKPFDFEKGAEPPRRPPSSDVWADAMQNRNYKTVVISIICKILAATYKPPTRPRVLAVDFVNVIKIDFGPVSYTHLRAHETLRYLVCRLLLEK